ncbi:MAG: hypothetical protein HQ581_11195 [Planctomycetes bacterium]|nr:hypothetical protein [Planctomycetota bacterium]
MISKPRRLHGKRQAEARSQRVALSGQLQTIVDLMGATRPISDSIELTEDSVYLVARGLKLGRR